MIRIGELKMSIADQFTRIVPRCSARVGLWHMDHPDHFVLSSRAEPGQSHLGKNLRHPERSEQSACPERSRRERSRGTFHATVGRSVDKRGPSASLRSARDDGSRSYAIALRAERGIFGQRRKRSFPSTSLRTGASLRKTPFLAASPFVVCDSLGRRGGAPWG